MGSLFLWDRDVRNTGWMLFVGQARSEHKLDAVYGTGTFGTQVGCCFWDREVRNTSWMLFLGQGSSEHKLDAVCGRGTFGTQVRCCFNMETKVVKGLTRRRLVPREDQTVLRRRTRHEQWPDFGGPRAATGSIAGCWEGVVPPTELGSHTLSGCTRTVTSVPARVLGSRGLSLHAYNDHKVCPSTCARIARSFPLPVLEEWP